MVKDALIDSTKTWPSSQKSAALALAQLRDPHANFPRVMLPLHDEINKIVQRLEKVISVKNGEA